MTTQADPVRSAARRDMTVGPARPSVAGTDRPNHEPE